MSEINIGAESAFPVLEREWEEYSDIYKYSMTAGLTKREYFAGLAMQGYIACHSHPQAVNPPEENKAAKWAVGYADALIKALGESHV